MADRDAFDASAPGWPGLFWEAFTSSKNAMLLLDEGRRHVAVNGAYIQLLGHKPEQLIGRPFWELVRGGRKITSEEWTRALGQRRFTGTADLIRADGTPVRVEFAAHPELVTGRRLVLGVALKTARAGRQLPDSGATAHRSAALSEREREVVGLIALGLSGREIADELHITHNTVRKHASNAMSKLGARSRAQLVAMAMAEGLVLAKVGPPRS